MAAHEVLIHILIYWIIADRKLCMNPETLDQKLGVDLTSMVVPLPYTSLYLLSLSWHPIHGKLKRYDLTPRKSDLIYVLVGKLLSLEIISVCDAPCQQLLAETMLLFFKEPLLLAFKLLVEGSNVNIIYVGSPGESPKVWSRLAKSNYCLCLQAHRL